MTKDTLKLTLCVCALLLAFISAAQAQSPGLSLGQAAPDFVLKDVRGKTQALKDYRGKIVVVGFLSTECPIVNAYHERLRALARDYSARGVALLGFYPNSNEPLTAIKARAAEHKFAFPVLKDEGSATADLYHAQSTPEMFVIDGTGRLRYHGRIDNSPELSRVKRHDLRAALDELLAGQSVSVAETRAFGCQIRRRAAVATTKAAAPANSEQVKGLLKPVEFARLREQLRGQVLVVNFWATWCGPCVAEFPEFVRIDKKYRARGVKVISISADETAELQSKVVPFIRKQNAKFDVYVQDVDEPEDMIKQFSREWTDGLPATFVFDKQGRLTQSFLGIIDRDKLEAAIEAALKL